MPMSPAALPAVETVSALSADVLALTLIPLEVIDAFSIYARLSRLRTFTAIPAPIEKLLFPPTPVPVPF